jgi:hypothetical protein
LCGQLGRFLLDWMAISAAVRDDSGVIRAELYPDRVAAIVAGGHEIAVHGYTHTPPARLTPAEEEAELIRARKLLEGAGAAVAGYHAVVGLHVTGV